MGTVLRKFFSLQLLGQCKYKFESRILEREGLWLHILRGAKSPGPHRDVSSAPSTHPLRMKPSAVPASVLHSVVPFALSFDATPLLLKLTLLDYPGQQISLGQL